MKSASLFTTVACSVVMGLCPDTTPAQSRADRAATVAAEDDDDLEVIVAALAVGLLAETAARLELEADLAAETAARLALAADLATVHCRSKSMVTWNHGACVWQSSVFRN